MGSAHPAFLTEDFESVHESHRRVACLDEILHADLVGFRFIGAAVTQQCGLSCAEGGSRGRAAGACGHAGYGEQQGAQGNHLRFFNAAGYVTLGHVSQFVTEHAGHLILAREVHEQPGEYVDVPAGNGEGVHGVVQNDSRMEIEGLRWNGGGNALHKIAHVFAHFGILHDGQVGADHDVKLVSHFLFVFQGDAAKEKRLRGSLPEGGKSEDKESDARSKAEQA